MTGYSIGGRFALQRSYIKGIAINAPYDSTVILSDNPYVLQLSTVWGSPQLILHFKDQFHDWSSNTYTSDWIIDDFHGQYPSVPPNPIDPYPLRFVDRPGYRSQYLSPGLSFFDSMFYFDLPHAPAGFWFQFPD
jgi:hypothetical protein